MDQEQYTPNVQQQPTLQAQLDSLIRTMRDGGLSFDECAREFKRRFIVQVLTDKRGNNCRAADELGMHRNTLLRACGELKVDVAEIRGLAKSTRRRRRPSGINLVGGLLSNAKGAA